MWLLLAPSTSCALIRTRPPALRTLPSSTCVALSSRATLGMSTCLSLYMNALLREITASAEILLRSVMTSSVMPSLKYSCSGSPLMLADCAACVRAIVVPSARRNSCAWTDRIVVPTVEVGGVDGAHVHRQARLLE